MISLYRRRNGEWRAYAFAGDIVLLDMEAEMLDLVFIGLAVATLVAMAIYARLCARL
jgi:hypothetical protein